MSNRQFEAKILKMKIALQFERLENRKLRQKLKEVKSSRDYQWDKVRRLRKSVTNFERNGIVKKFRHFSAGSINRHKYELWLVNMCISLYIFAGCSFRSVRRVLLCFQLEMGFKMPETPSKSSIENWVQKVGYHQYLQRGSDIWEDYCLIVDESMVVGEERMLLVLGASAKKEGEQGLTFEEVRVLGFSVRPSWKADGGERFLRKSAREYRTKSQLCY